jgi:ribonucleotide monophosphatase NagD (HAD superfamily)
VKHAIAKPQPLDDSPRCNDAAALLRFLRHVGHPWHFITEPPTESAQVAHELLAAGLIDAAWFEEMDGMVRGFTATTRGAAG